MVLGLKSTHPSVHDALALLLMDGTISMEAVDLHMHYYYEMHMAQLAQNGLMNPSSIALPASLLPHANICPNCKKPGHSIKFYVAPGGKMAGQSARDAVTCQRAVCEASRPQTDANPCIQVEDDGTTLVIGGFQLKVDRLAANLADADIDLPMTPADQGE